MKNGETFTTKTGVVYTASKVSTWQAGDGRMITSGYVTIHETIARPGCERHGWGGSMTAEQWAADKAAA
jgi:hypothetical protein